MWILGKLWTQGNKCENFLQLIHETSTWIHDTTWCKLLAQSFCFNRQAWMFPKIKFFSLSEMNLSSNMGYQLVNIFCNWIWFFFFKFYFWFVACTWKQLIPGVSLKSHPSSLKNCFSSDRIEERSIWIWCVNVWSDPTRDIACHPTWGQDTRKCTSPMGVEIIGIRYHFRASPPTWSSTGNLCIFQDAKISR